MLQLQEGKSKLADSREKEEMKGKEAYDRGDYEEAVKCWMASLRSVKYLLDKKLYAHNAEHQKQVEMLGFRTSCSYPDMLAVGIEEAATSII